MRGIREISKSEILVVVVVGDEDAPWDASPVDEVRIRDAETSSDE
jgi:hypothetical protein